MLDAATAAIGGPSTDAASLSEVEAAEAGAATAVASGVPTSCADCVGQASGCGGGGCTLTAGSNGDNASNAGAKSGPPLGLTPSTQNEKCQPAGWSSVERQPVCLQ